MKIAIITGGNRGVGKSAALHIAAKGIGVLLTYRNHQQEAEEVVAQIQKAGGQAVALQFDVTNTENIQRFVEEVTHTLQSKWNTKTFDYLINNAGISQRATILETTEQQFDDLVNTNFKGPYFLSQKLYPLMNENGHMINISSGLARFSVIGMAVYGALKGAIDVLTRYQAQEFAAKKIRVNSVAPGALDTDFGGGRTDQAREQFSNMTLQGRMGNAEDIGLMLASMLTEDFRWVNAQRIEVTGGFAV